MIDTTQTFLSEEKVRWLTDWIAHSGYQVACEIAEHKIAYHQAKGANAALASFKHGIPLEFTDEMREADYWLTFRAALKQISTNQDLLRVLTLNPGIHRD
jgi:hypothetical protein